MGADAQRWQGWAVELKYLIEVDLEHSWGKEADECADAWQHTQSTLPEKVVKHIQGVPNRLRQQAKETGNKEDEVKTSFLGGTGQ